MQKYGPEKVTEKTPRPNSSKQSNTGKSLTVYLKHKKLKSNLVKMRRTICEVLREIYRSADERGDHFTMSKAEEAHDMAKRMQYKLYELQGHKVHTISVRNADGTYRIEEVDHAVNMDRLRS